MYRLAIMILFLISCQSAAVQGGSKGEVRGVWLTNVDSDVLTSREKIAEAMQFLSDHNFNLVCPVVWNKAVTLYPSEVMEKNFGIRIDTLYAGRDPLQELIEEAHKRGIAVFAWFEFGFSSSYKAGGGHILAKKPEWAAQDLDGNLLKKNGFEWMNGYHPEVRKFMTDLVLEVVRNYAVDGVQGDDRLPAQPSSGGYSAYTRALYRETHDGEEPPEDYMDAEWLRWRADLLNKFAHDLYRAVKKADPQVLVTWAPSIHPWAYEEYLQEWPAWIRGGYADLVVPQNYRYSIEEYKETLDSQRPEAVGLSPEIDIIYPGVLLNVGDYIIDKDFLLQSIAYNRAKGVNGEIFFFYEGLRRQNGKLANVLLDSYYKEPASLPFKVRQKFDPD